MALVVLTLIIAFVALVVFALVVKASRQRRRRDQLVQWAARNGWSVTPTPAVDWGARLPGGNRKGVSVALSAMMGGRPVSIAEYSYTENATGSPQTHQFIVTVVRLAQSYPPVAVQPRHALSKLVKMGGDSFERQFKVEGAHQLVGPALVAEHLAGTVPPWNLYGNELLAYRHGRLDRPDQIPALVSPLVRVADLLGR
jgi:hypothetical protein